MTRSTNQAIRTLRLRIKDKHFKTLSAMAREVNFVWNFCNELSIKVFEPERRFMSGYDFHPYTAGATKEVVDPRPDGASNFI